MLKEIFLPLDGWPKSLSKYNNAFFPPSVFFTTLFYTDRDTKNGGPVHWIHENYQCPNCKNPSSNTCCQNTNGGYCKADSVSMADDPDVNM